MFVDDPGLSIVAVDPGGTTGIAIWDSWGQKLYVDQIDAGRGRKARERVFGGVIESPERRRAVKKVSKQNEMAILSIVESGVVTVLCEIVLAAGPHAIVVCEDFILNWGRSDIAARSGGREGLSAVRIGSRLDDRLLRDGYFNGDAWRNYGGVFEAHGMDGRGLKLASGRGGVLMDYRERLKRAEKHIDGGGAVWGGSGIKLVWRLPGTRFWLPGGEKAAVAWMREAGMWMPGAPHGMDALQHLLAFSRRMGAEIRQTPERLWRLGEKGKNSDDLQVG